MCGLAGMVGSLEPKHRQVMKELLYLTALRGRDSTGLTAVRRDKTVLTRKMTVPASEFIEYPIVDKAMCFGDQVWLGHCRYKTTGEVSRANAHPFEICDNENYVLLVGTHNGTLDNKWKIENLLDKHRFETDSEALFHWLVEADNYKKAIAEVKGAWSLVWWDPTTDKLHFLRNDKRPLVYAYSKDRKVLVWASEAWMILAASRRNGLELEQNDKGLSCWSTVTDTLYSLDIPQERDKPLPDLKREGGYTGAPVGNFREEGNARWKSWWANKVPVEEREKQAEKGKKETKADGKKEDKTVVTIGEPPVGDGVKGFNGTNLSRGEFNAVLAKGCVWHKGPINEEEPFAFVADDSIVCSRCLRDMHQKERPDVDYSDIDEDEDFLDDDLPFALGPAGFHLLKQEEIKSAETKEGKTLIERIVEKTVG